jgi:O-acetyl-ADP-ribose deacetylase (regulator of RNase III)
VLHEGGVCGVDARQAGHAAEDELAAGEPDTLQNIVGCVCVCVCVCV